MIRWPGTVLIGVVPQTETFKKLVSSYTDLADTITQSSA
jgi:hypothetical protein